MSNVNIISIGKYLPQNGVNAKEKYKEKGVSEKIFKRLSMEKLYIAEDMESQCYMAIKAAKQALKNSDIAPSQIDILIFTYAFIPDFLAFSCHAYIQKQLGIKNAFSFDLCQGCNGVVAGIELIELMLQLENYNYALIIAADKWHEDFIDRWKATPMSLFSDGAGAILVGNGGNSLKILASLSRTDTSFSMNDYVKLGNTPGLKPFYLNEPYRYGETHELLPNWKKTESRIRLNEFIDNQITVLKDCLKKCSLLIEDIDYIILYNASLYYYKKLFEKLKFPLEKSSYVYAKQYGHMGTADLIVSLYDVLKKNIIKKGQVVAAICAGRGGTYGSFIIEI